jgi:hypothetical protein
MNLKELECVDIEWIHMLRDGDYKQTHTREHIESIMNRMLFYIHIYDTSLGSEVI